MYSTLFLENAGVTRWVTGRLLKFIDGRLGISQVSAHIREGQCGRFQCMEMYGAQLKRP